MEHTATKKIDRRQVRTKRRIRDAFMELIMEKPMEKLTIKELAERADIDRKTFYLHYDSHTTCSSRTSTRWGSSAGSTP